MELAGTLSTRLKEFSQDDLLYQALLTRMCQTSFGQSNPGCKRKAGTSRVSFTAVALTQSARYG